MDGGRILRALLTRKMDFVRATDVSVRVARVVAIAFGLYGLLGGAYQLLLLAPFLWMMGTREQMLARVMADRYAYGRDGYVERTPQWNAPRAQAPRRFTIVQRGGRLVIEEV